MIFTTIVCLEVIFFVVWLACRIAGMIRRHKILSSILIIGIVYFMISGHSSNILNTNSQKNNNLANAGQVAGSITGNSIDSSSVMGLISVIYPGDNCHETGADGHRITLHNNESAINPTYRQMVNFIKSDKTDEVQYNYSSFISTDFAERVHNNAEAAGYRCSWVRISFVNGGDAYACNAFDTVDRGLVFIDCTDYGYPDNDKIVDLKVGKKYSPEGLGDFRFEYYSMGIVKNYQIYW